MTRNNLLRCSFALALLGCFISSDKNSSAAEPGRPNILFCIADDWGWPHAGAYGDPVVQTPAFDRLAREGVLFENAFVSSPSCTPCRNSILTGQWHWRLGQGGNLWSTLGPEFPVYPFLLEDAGYFIGHWRKAWGPGDWRALGRTEDPAADVRQLCEIPDSATGPHAVLLLARHFRSAPAIRLEKRIKSGIEIDRIRLPADLPDHEAVRHDVADYYFEVQRFDRDVAAALRLLEQSGDLDNTIVVMTGDHGMPFPRHKCQLYDSGTHVPLAIRWGAQVQGGRSVTDFVSLADLAPTFLAAAGVTLPRQMTGRPLVEVLRSVRSGRVDPSRDHVLTGRERHGQSQEKPHPGGYPMRAIRTDDFLYIRNSSIDLWPGGCPDADKAYGGNAYGDCDGSPTKEFIIQHRDDLEYRVYYEMAFAKRPAEELYDMRKDPHQLTNIADQPAYVNVKEQLAERLLTALKATGDPRVLGDGDTFDHFPYRRRGKR